ncbi:MAG: imidazolonepropionase [Thermoplasmatales archaeon]|nr:imidazolonepropionase [Thermoplasmatales archaeon]
MSLLIKNIGEIFDGYKIRKEKYIYIEDGKIKSIGEKRKADEIIDARGNFVMPGFVDCHTHAVFAGYRDFEVDWKIEGASHHQIAERGGGIFYTVRETRKASKERIKKETKERIEEMIRHGTTTAEVKSGYGLDLKNEVKLLQIIREIDKNEKIDLLPTFLAHAIPEGEDEDDYVDYVINEIIPYIGEKKLAIFCDVFCEKGYFSVNSSRKILQEGKKYGMIPKIHADEFSCIGCSKLAAQIKAISADHLLKAGLNELKLMAKAGVTAVILPAVPFLLGGEFPSYENIKKSGINVAIATDLNPNCYVPNMQFAIQIACYKMKMKIIDALKYATINSAKTLKMDEHVGNIEVGKKADIIITNIPSHSFALYKIGINFVDKVIKEGEIIYESEH